MSIHAYLVEDSKAIRENLIPALKLMAGIDVIGEAADEQSALRWFRAGTADWDLAIVDLFLEKGSGLLVLSALRERRPDQKVIVLSNYCTEVTRDRCKKLGADRMFDKSSQLDLLFDYCIRLGQKSPDGVVHVY